MDMQRIVAHPAAPAAACAALVALMYHILGNWSIAGDALRACASGIAALACLAWARRVRAGGLRRAGGKSAPAAALACVLASVAGVAVPIALGSQVAPQPLLPSPALLAVLALSCLGTAVWEELLFRRLLFDAARTRVSALTAALACSLVFAVLHAGSAAGVLPGALRLVQVFAFGLAMAGIETSGKLGLAWAVAVHAVYDLVSFVPALLDVGGLTMASDPWFLPAQLLFALETTVPGMLASTAVLAPVAFWAYSHIRKMG